MRVARAVSAWLQAPADTEAYSRLVAAVERWEGYGSPTLAPEDELLDEMADQNPPQPLGDVIPELEAALRRRARLEL